MDPMELPLRDIHLPADIGWWPPAPGWWVLAAAVLVAVGFAVRRLLRPRRVDPVKEADTRMASVEAAFRDSGDTLRLLQDLSGLLRQVAMSALGRPAAAAPVGAEWLALLDRLGDTDAFTAGAGRALADGPYRPAAAADADAVLAVCRDWLRRVADARKASKGAAS